MLFASLFVLTALVLVFVAKKHLAALKQLEGYRPLSDIDAEVEKRKQESEKLAATILQLKAQENSLSNSLAILLEADDLTSAGFYKPKYNFNDSKKYEERLDVIREKQKQLIKDKAAIICKTEWRVGDSRAEGKKMTDRNIKLGLSAFNVQCDNEILKVKFDNVDRAREKISKIREKVDKLLEPTHCYIQDRFLDLKLEELYLVYEYQEQAQKEKDEQKAIKEQMREEEKARKEIERIQAEAEREEERYTAALEKARKDLEKKSDSDRDAFLHKIASLEAKLKEAHENKERAKSQAEMTKRGHVYVISNIGSFGEHVYKIGMTRRLDPMDRVYELGDASVPFEFDVHALIQSDDAPALERALHDAFTNRRMNMVNQRKEFFRVDLMEIQNAVEKHHRAEFRMTLIAEAKEWRQTHAMTADKHSKAS